MSHEGFDWNKWATEGMDPTKLPTEERVKVRSAFGAPAADPLEALLRTNRGIGGTGDNDDDEPLKRSDVMGLLNEVRKQDRFERELTEVRKQYGESYEKYALLAKPFIDQGYSPTHAFKLASADDLLVAAEEKGRRTALEGVQAERRNGEQPIRGNGAQGSGVQNNAGGSGNVWIDDKEAYEKKRAELGSSRMDMTDAIKFRYENPDFREAEFHHGDLKKVSRRGPT